MQRRLRPIISLLIITLLCARLVASGAPPLAQAQEPTVHIVQDGENLFRIAIRYGTTVEAIATANGLANANEVYAGQQLIIPVGSSGIPSTGAAATTGGTYGVQQGDTLITIAWRYGLRLSDLMQANEVVGFPLLYTGQTLVIPGAGGALPAPPSSDTYIVHPGDALPAIAERYGTSAFAVAHANGIASPSEMHVGQLLRVAGPGITPLHDKHILIDISQQHLYAYDRDELIYSFVCSSGKAPYYTRYGEFQVQSKIPNAYGSTWDIWMPHWLGVYWAGGTENGIHALPILPNGQTLWAGYLGRPVSYGCIVLGTGDAKRLYDWAEMGTPVSIQP